MSTVKSAYYSNELSDWAHAIGFYEEEIDKLGHQLGEVISRNSIVGIAEKVEAEQLLLNQAADRFRLIQAEIEGQDDLLWADNTFIEDSGITGDMQEKQDQLRKKMQEAEKDYVDVKFKCYRFLSDTLKK